MEVEVKTATFKFKLEAVTQGKRSSRQLGHWVLSGLAQSDEDLREDQGARQEGQSSLRVFWPLS